jgi:glucose dehydrogenase
MTETPSSRGGGLLGRPAAATCSPKLVCLDVRTGKRVWHFQAVHHGIWTDFNAQPNLIDIAVDGRRIDDRRGVEAGVRLCLDRVTSQPVWPSKSARCRAATHRVSVARPRRFPRNRALRSTGRRIDA